MPSRSSQPQCDVIMEPNVTAQRDETGDQHEVPNSSSAGNLLDNGEAWDAVVLLSK